MSDDSTPGVSFAWEHVVPPLERFEYRLLLPAEWVKVQVPEEKPDFNNPALFLPICVYMAPYAAIVFSAAVRPGYDDGTPQQWIEYLCREQGFEVKRTTPGTCAGMEAVYADAIQQTEAGPMRMRLVLFHGNGNLFNLSTMAPAPLWDSVAGVFEQMIMSFTFPRQTAELAAAPKRAPDPEPPPTPAELRDGPRPGDETPDPAEAAQASPANIDTPTRHADVALADDASSLDPDHKLNAYFRDNGIGLVPRVLAVNADEKYATIGLGAIVAVTNLPLGWHVIDDGRRSLVFDPGNQIQVNLNVFAQEGTPLEQIADRIVADAAAANPDLQHIHTEIGGLPVLGLRNLTVDGEQLEQAFLWKDWPNVGPGMLLQVRVTATPSEMVRAMNLAEVIIRDLRTGE